MEKVDMKLVESLTSFIERHGGYPPQMKDQDLRWIMVYAKTILDYLQAVPMIESLSASLGRGQYPGCSCHACGGISSAGDPPGTWFNACPLCQHKRCPHCEDHRYECTASNEPGQVGTLLDDAGLFSEKDGER